MILNLDLENITARRMHALLTFIDKVAHAIDDVSHTIGVFLDLSKAFDTINHDILIYKLRHYGVRGNALDWFRDDLTNRKQFVSINGCDSQLKQISCGVPQGSLLGPLLFIVYINDLHNSSQILSFICYADDSNLFFAHRWWSSYSYWQNECLFRLGFTPTSYHLM